MENVIQKILLSKGPCVTPRLVNSALAGKYSVSDIIQVMKYLTTEGVGHYEESSVKSVTRKLFIKKPLDEIKDAVERYGARADAYNLLYNMPSTLRY